MRQTLQNLATGELEFAEVCPHVNPAHVLLRTTRSLISPGTERMLRFRRAGVIEKARQQPDRLCALDKDGAP